MGKFALALVAVAGLFLSGCGYNTIQTTDEQTKAAWSEVLNQYQRRADLIPNLVATVKGAANFEKSTYIAVTEARAKVGQVNTAGAAPNDPAAFSQFSNAQDNLSSALSRLLVTVENYPNLKASQNFEDLQAQLEGTENRIAVARRDYIDAVQQYNTTLRTIPGRWIAGIFYPDAKVKQNFTISEQAQQAPQVKF